MTALARTPCRTCRAEVGLVCTVLGYDVALDPEPLTPLEELTALVAGRSTFTRYRHSGAVHPRLPHTIRQRPAGTRPRQDVHAVHRCTPPTPPPPRMSA